MLRWLLRSNWIFLVVGFVIISVVIASHSGGGGGGGSRLAPGYAPSADDINLIASACGILSFAIQVLVWTINIVLWVARRIKAA